MMNLNAVKFSLVAFFGGLLLAACGDDVTKVTEVSKSGLEVVASADSLGKCTEEISGEMKFAQKENAVYVCADSAWKNVSAAEKVSCSAEPLKDSSGFKIVCGGDSVGVVLNGNREERRSRQGGNLLFGGKPFRWFGLQDRLWRGFRRDACERS